MTRLLRRPEAVLPFGLSVVALAVIGGHLLVAGPPAALPHDEGAAARIFQVVIAVELLAIVAFAGRWLPREPRRAGSIAAAQLIALAVPILVILALEA